MALERGDAVIQAPINPNQVNILGQRIREACASTTASRFEIEMALILCYVNISSATGSWPEATRQQRADIFMQRASAALAQLVVDVTHLADVEVPGAALLALTPQTTH